MSEDCVKQNLIDWNPTTFKTLYIWTLTLGFNDLVKNWWNSYNDSM